MFLVYVYCLERNAKTAKSLLLPGRLPEIGAVFFWPSSHVIYPWESYFPLAEHPYKSNHQHNCTGLAEAVNKYKSNTEFLPLFFSEILTCCDLLRTFWGWVAFPAVVSWILGAAYLINEKLMHLHREVD